MAYKCLHLPFACDDTKDICFVFLFWWPVVVGQELFPFFPHPPFFPL